MKVSENGNLSEITIKRTKRKETFSRNKLSSNFHNSEHLFQGILDVCSKYNIKIG